MQFEADLTRLMTTSRSMESKARDYKTAYEALLREVNEGCSGWQGADRMAFVSQVNGFRDDFERMHQLILAFADLLGQADKDYRSALNRSHDVARNI